MKSYDPNSVQSVARHLIDLGYYVVPLVSGSRSPRNRDWDTKSHEIVGDRIDIEFGSGTDAGIGVLLGTSRERGCCIMGIDVDVNDDQLINRIKLALPSVAPTKFGSKGLTFFVYTSAPYPTKHPKQGHPLPVDILSRKSMTVIPPSIHYKSNNPYVWVDKSLHDFAPLDLPHVGNRELDEIRLAFDNPESPFFALNDMEGSTDTTPGTVHNSVLAAVAVMVTLNWSDDAIWSRVSRATERLALTGYKPDPRWEQIVLKMAHDAREKGFDAGVKSPLMAATDWMIQSWRGPDTVFNLDGAPVAYRDGHYDVLSAYDVRHAVANQCPIQFKGGHNDWDKVRLTVVDRVPQFVVSDRHIVCLRNGTVDIDTGCLSDWSRHDHILTSLPFDYDPTATCPTYESFLQDVFRGEDCDQCASTFEEFVAYTLIPSLEYQKFMVFRGPPATGKSVLLHIIGMMHDERTVTAISTAKFGDEKYSADMVGKLVNLTSEVASFSYTADDFLKAVTAGDRIVVRHLYAPPLRVVLPTRIVIGCNEMFRVRDSSGAIERRMIVLPCENVVPEDKQDSKLRSKLRIELPGIFNRLLVAWARLTLRGRFDPPSSIQKRELANFSLENNHTLQWYQERTHQGIKSVNDDYEMPASLPETENLLLFRDHDEWARANGFKPISSVTFGMRLSNISRDLHPTVKKVGGKAVKVRPLSLIDDQF